MQEVLMPRPIPASSACAALVSLSLLAACPAGAGEPLAPADPLRAFTWRSIGPANMGGRVSTLAVPEGEPSTLWMGLGTGGLFKTTNLGTTWTPVFDDQPTASIGDVAVWPRNPKVVWVGTGESNNRNSSSWGNGVYRSDDGGATWVHRGLEATHDIARVVLHPTDSSVAWVAALGHLWGENPERGVYRTTDGGRTWTRVLHLDARTGAIDLALDPRDPQVLYAAMYTRLRRPWSYEGGSTRGGIFRSRDGGRTWEKCTVGLPRHTGRIGLEVWRQDPRVVFAVVESDEGGFIDEFEEKSRSGGVFRSDDWGATWRRLTDLVPRPFYYGRIRVQPDDSTRVYLLGTDLWISDDGGHTFRAGGARNLHPDLHAMWIDRDDPRRVWLGTDGGLFVSHDRAATWDYLNDLAIGEFYNIALDTRDPYYVYGGLQDNQTWGGPSRTRFEVRSWMEDDKDLGILNDHWFVLGGGDGFHVAIDPTDPDIVYWESQGGAMMRTDLASGERRRLRPTQKEGLPTLRFNWNAPFQISPHDPTVLWLGSNHLLRLEERGDRWSLASPDLTTRDPARMATGGSGAEQHCTITTLAESPLRRGQVWVGTDDGKVWVTPDGGATWEDLTARVPAPARGLYVSRLEPSHHDPRTAYLAIDGHRSDVFTPFLFVTRDLGRTWTSLASGLPRGVPVKVVREDLVHPRLLFAGTETGIHVSRDGGVRWTRLGQGLPTVAVDDMAIHPRERDLVVGTHGRSVYVLDDIGPLQQWSAAVERDTVTLFVPRATTVSRERELGAVWGQRGFAAKNPPYGAWIDYHLPREIEGGVSIVIADSAGRTVRTLRGPGAPGLHRVVWDLVPGEPRERIPRPEWSNQPLLAAPGRYAVTLTCARAAPRRQTLVLRPAERAWNPAR
jgi:photosystem II stability/assembly factor-like uncharacterized protein